MSGVGRTLVRNGRIIFEVPPQPMMAEANRLKHRLDVLLPPWCADHCWTKGTSEDEAYAKIQPRWGFLDITSFFTSIYQHRLFWLLRREPELLAQLRQFFRRLGCHDGVPEGCSFSPTLANLYLAAIDLRWAGTSVRYGDNIACFNPPRYAAELLNIGLLATERPNFTNRVAGGGPSSPVSATKE